MKHAGTPILWPVRAWLFVEVLFTLGAIAVTTFDPAHTAGRFAWDVQPPVMAAVLGGYYVATLPLTLMAIFARRWEMIRVIVLPTVLFTLVALVATLLHWARFSVGSTAFTVWLLSYVLPPPILLAGYAWQQRRARQAGVAEPAGAIPAVPLPREVRLALLHWGGLAVIGAAVVFIFPFIAIALGPWRLTPLTARVFATLILAAGALMLTMVRENDRARVLMGVPTLLLVFPLVTVQIARFSGDVNFANPFLFVVYGVLVIAFVLGVYLARGDWRQAFS